MASYGRLTSPPWGRFIGVVAARSGLSRKALRLYEVRGNPTDSHPGINGSLPPPLWLPTLSALADNIGACRAIGTIAVLSPPHLTDVQSEIEAIRGDQRSARPATQAASREKRDGHCDGARDQVRR